MFIVVCGRAGSVAVGACVGTFPTLEEAVRCARERVEGGEAAATVARVVTIATPSQPAVPQVTFEDVR